VTEMHRGRRATRRLPLIAFLLALLGAAAPAQAATLLEVTLDETTPGVMRVGVRDGKDMVPAVTVNDQTVQVQVTGRQRSARWQPLVMILDTSNISQDLLDKIKANILALAKREFDNGSQLVIVGDQTGGKLDAHSAESINGTIKPMLDEAKLIPPSADPKKPAWSTIALQLKQQLGSTPVSSGEPWALVFSSLCVGPDDPGLDLSGFGGPVRFLTWDKGLSPKCLENREKWLAATTAEKKEISKLDDPAQKAQVDAARDGRSDVMDEVVSVAGLQYDGEPLTVTLAVDASAAPWKSTLGPDTVPDAWQADAVIRAQKKSRRAAIGAFLGLVVVVAVVIVLRARGGAAEVQKWEAAGEAEDLSSSMDPDAWNATIFQLTGAMPVLKEIREAAQIGPAAGAAAAGAAAGDKGKGKGKGGKDEPTVGGPAAAPAGAKETMSTGATQPVPPPAASGAALPSTGMTVAIPVLDDGTGYEADQAFEIGVLFNGKPVARKTKRFRKVFSIGRATDNRVVIQKDDTVHRYHVVIRPAMAGKEWWLEVSPTSTNRTNLNGKDLRAGGRYRLPDKFRLQLGEATEVRGRMAGAPE